jgi:hypothetical protein
VATAANAALRIDLVVGNRHYLGGHRKCACWDRQTHEFQLETAFAEEVSWVAKFLQPARQIRAAWEYRTAEHRQRTDMAQYWITDVRCLRREPWLIKGTLKKGSGWHD